MSPELFNRSHIEQILVLTGFALFLALPFLIPAWTAYALPCPLYPRKRTCAVQLAMSA